MRILLAQNSRYYPAHGGGDKSNRLLIEALAARGHACRVVARIPVFGPEEHVRYIGELSQRGISPTVDQGVVKFERRGVDAHVVTNSGIRSYFAGQVSAFQPDVILTSTDDPAQLLLEEALNAEAARVVYLARATLALPFGPDCAFASESKAARIRAADAVVGVSEYVARYIREHGGMPATHVPLSLLEPEDWPDLGRFENEFVTMVNPCAVKGISIFLSLADALPQTQFAAVLMWGTNAQDREELARRPNIRLLEPVDNIDLLLKRTRVLLVPSIWAEARSRIVLEAMLRGVPVIASDVGGIPEAKMGVPYLLPVNPIRSYKPRLDDQMVPIAEVPEQDIEPWSRAISRLTSDPAHYSEIARASRAAALDYAAHLSAEPFESLLFRTLDRPRDPRRYATLAETSGEAAATAPNRTPAAALNLDSLSPEKRRLLGLRLRQRAPASAWFPGAEQGSGLRLFCFPYAGGGAAVFQNWDIHSVSVCPVRFPGRESRLQECPFEDLHGVVGALTAAICAYLDRPFAFFGHSMGAAVAFELARSLRRKGMAQPQMLIASAARAPQFRRNHVPPPAPEEQSFLEELRRLQGISEDALSDPLILKAILPTLRADTALYRGYVYHDEKPLAVPIRAYGGTGDPNIGCEHLEGWAEQTTASFAVRRFPGGHFYIQESREELLQCIAADLENSC